MTALSTVAIRAGITMALASVVAKPKINAALEQITLVCMLALSFVEVASVAQYRAAACVAPQSNL
jgi:hypothetical protein